MALVICKDAGYWILAYIRAKKLKNEQYLYLVKSVWDKKRCTSKQEIIKYLGKASGIAREDIPAEYRNDTRILAAIVKHNPKTIRENGKITEKIKRDLYKKLTDGNIQEALRIHKEYVKNFYLVSFFDRILSPVMQKIGEDWATDKISIATEHIASNTAQGLIKMISEQIPQTRKNKAILICVPVGEEHRMGCDVLETYLSSKGFKIYNMGTSIPTVTILDFIGTNRPDVIFVSITLKDNIPAGQRLVKRIRAKSGIPVLVGGRAMQGKEIPKFDAKIVSVNALNEIPKILSTV